MSLFVGVLIGLIIGLPVGLFFGVRDKRRPTEPTQTDDQAEMRFGHPWPPLKTLRDRLPDAPMGCVWESSVQYDSNGEAVMCLALIEVVSERTVASTKISLVHGKYGRYSEDYRKYSIIKRSIFNDELIGPLVDWASSQVNKYANAGKTYGYRMET